MKNGNLILPASPSGLKIYFIAARPRTWPLSLAPVCIGTCMAENEIDWILFALTLLFSLFIQIGTNYANDYFDFIKGVDTKERIGPQRATAAGWISPSKMLTATCMTFLLALLIAIPLMIRVGLWSFPLAALCVLFGITYTGGPKPLGYLGAGEILVFIFFGPIACCGAYFLQTGVLSWDVFISSLAPAFFSTAVLVVNNLRDEVNDRKTGKKTLIARFGRRFGSWEYAMMLGAGCSIPLFLVLLFDGSWLLLAVWLLAIPAIRKVFTFQHHRELIGVLQATALLLVLYTLLFCATCG